MSMTPPSRPSACFVASILATQLEIAVEQIVPTAGLFTDLQAPPLALVRAAMALEEAFGISIPDDSLAGVRTVEDFMALVAKRSRPPSARAHSAPGWGPPSTPSNPAATGGRVRMRAPRRLRRGRWA